MALAKQNVSKDKKPQKELDIFISHPHEYKDIADVLRRHINDWSGGDIEIHQTSDAGSNPVAIGDMLRHKLMEQLGSSKIILLIYVRAESANYTMFEAGVASARADTRIVVFQCEDEVPTTFKEDLLVKMTKDSIDKYTYDFHRTVNFFPKSGFAYKPKASKTSIDRKSAQLYNDLLIARPRKEKPTKIHHPWIYFTLSLGEAYINEIIQEAHVDERIRDREKIMQILKKAHKRAIELIEGHAIIEKCPGHLAQHFNMDRIREGEERFVNLYNRWSSGLVAKEQTKYIDIDWWGEICKQLFRSIANYRAEEISTPMKSAHEPLTWYLPVVTKTTTIPADKKSEFDICLVRIPEKSVFVKITIPKKSVKSRKAPEKSDS